MMRPIAQTVCFGAAALLAAALLTAPAAADGMPSRGKVGAPAPAPAARRGALSAHVGPGSGVGEGGLAGGAVLGSARFKYGRAFCVVQATIGFL